MSKSLLIPVGEHYIDADHVVGVNINFNREVTVTLADGERVWVPCDYNKTPYDTQKRIVDEINAARSNNGAD
ncbi:hypothetical protein C2W27_14435 [Salmonella enterica]|nr:hypothetical protein [Salmonella enterica]